MSLDGRIIEFIDADSLRLGYVRKQERDRLLVVDPRGRNLSVSSDRVVIVHRAAPESEFPPISREIAERVAKRQAEVDLELLWQSLEGAQREMHASDLAALFFAEESPDSESAVFRALFNDTLFFKRKGVLFTPRTRDQVDTERTRRKRQGEHEEFRRRATLLVSDLMRKKAVPDNPDTASILDRLSNWLRLRNGDEIGDILAEVAGTAKARDAAYDILMRAGRIDQTSDRFLVIAGIETRFPPAVLQSAEKLAGYVHSSSRVDYRDVPAFTIDDEDTREVDDALTVFRRNGEIVAGIHIADVSVYVAKGDPLDSEAARRSSTIYLPSSSVRMFPDRLSTDLSSLTAGMDRPAFTIEVRFTEDGQRIGYRMVLSTIRVAERLSYDQADAAIDAGHESLQLLQSIAKNLQKDRIERGAIAFRRPELKVRVHDGEIHLHRIDPNSPSRFLVSEMMILANGLSADFASVNGIPVIFRTQEPRDAVAVEDAPVVEAIAFERLRKTFKRSRLSLTPGAHSGLGLTAYTQASSPIRRYADLVTQRQFTSMLAGKPCPHTREELLQILARSEATEIEIRQLEERSTQCWLLQYLAKERMQDVVQAIVIDGKGNVELEDFYLRAKLANDTKALPGDRIRVRFQSIDPPKGELRLVSVGQE